MHCAYWINIWKEDSTGSGAVFYLTVTLKIFLKSFHVMAEGIYCYHRNELL